MIPYGYCHCGCGKQTQVSPHTYTRDGIKRGEPRKFIKGHNGRVGWDLEELRRQYRQKWADAGIKYGLCLCGCGQATTPAPNSRRRDGLIKGEPRPFCLGHGMVAAPLDDAYAPEDRGYLTPCWIWQRSCDVNGYGRLGGRGRDPMAHRYFYTQAKGPIPDGLALDHLCRVPRCVNPDHLEAVTHRENIQRGIRARAQGVPAQRAA